MRLQKETDRPNDMLKVMKKHNLFKAKYNKSKEKMKRLLTGRFFKADEMFELVRRSVKGEQ